MTPPKNRMQVINVRTPEYEKIWKLLTMWAYKAKVISEFPMDKPLDEDSKECVEDCLNIMEHITDYIDLEKFNQDPATIFFLTRDDEFKKEKNEL